MVGLAAGTLFGLGRRGRQHVANRRDAPAPILLDHDERRPHHTAFLWVAELVATVRDGHVLRREPHGLNRNRARTAGAIRRGQRAANDLLASPPPVAGRCQLIGVGREEVPDRLRVAVRPRGEILLDDRPDRRLRSRCGAWGAAISAVRTISITAIGILVSGDSLPAVADVGNCRTLGVRSRFSNSPGRIRKSRCDPSP